MERPKVGIGVFVIKTGKILYGKRLNKDGSFVWCRPGGHLENGESFEACAIRETLEETGVSIKNVRFGAVTNDIFSAEKQYVTIHMVSEYDSGVPSVTEPDLWLGWEWFSWDSVPEPFFLTDHNLKKQGFDPLGI